MSGKITHLKLKLKPKHFLAKNRFLTASALALGLMLPSAITLPTLAGQVLDGQTFFDSPPELIRSATSSMSTELPGIYQFTLQVPEDAGAPLGAVKVTQAENPDLISFDVERSTAFRGDSFYGGPAVPLAAIGGPQAPDAEEVTVAFDPPVQPGETVTVSLPAQRNPDLGGAYLFGVTAYPAGQQSLGQFLGYGRVNIFSGGG
ncbi:MAG: DUF2808 domain-containing protein [Leptolyngbyaceae bacterium]|nr:DUF2808 domain-containing protein [Leptolyngbyaceae bacterium]